MHCTGDRVPASQSYRGPLRCGGGGEWGQLGFGGSHGLVNWVTCGIQSRVAAPTLWDGVPNYQSDSSWSGQQHGKYLGGTVLAAQERHWPFSNQASTLGQKSILKNSITQGQGAIKHSGQSRTRQASLRRGGPSTHCRWGTHRRLAGLRQSSGSRKLWTWIRKKLHLFTNPHRDLTNPQLWIGISNKSLQYH